MSSEELKSADEWLKDPDYTGIVVMDPDGWDRHPDRWEKSWNEPICRTEFERRVAMSTCRLTREYIFRETRSLKQETQPMEASKFEPNTKVIYHRADFDGIFCCEIARKFLGTKNVEYIGWDYNDPVPTNIGDRDIVYMLDISVPQLMEHSKLIWIDHHKTAIEKYSSSINGYRIDGVAACRLAWQWFSILGKNSKPYYLDDYSKFPMDRQAYIDRKVNEPLSVRLAGEYDIWDKRDERVDLFQYGLNSEDLDWERLLNVFGDNAYTLYLVNNGRPLKYAREKENKSIITQGGFTMKFEGLTLLCCNAARYNSMLFDSMVKEEHDGCLGFKWTGRNWSVSLYGVKHKDVDLSAIAKKYGGGGHKKACGFACDNLPFALSFQNET